MIIPVLKKTYQDQLVLDFPKTEIADGSLVALCGPNGSGKSTLGKILAGVIKADDGCEKFPFKQVGYMNQHAFAFRLSVKTNLLQNKDSALSREENEARAEELMKVLQLSELAKKNAAKLSGGQKQRMSLARALMKDYKVLILDEPTASMDQHDPSDHAFPGAGASSRVQDPVSGGGKTLELNNHSKQSLNSFMFIFK